MVCPNRKPEGKLHVYFNGKDMGEVEPYIKDMGEVEPYIETDEDVRITNLLLARRLLTPRKGYFIAGVSRRIEAIRGPYAVRPLMH